MSQSCPIVALRLVCVNRYQCCDGQCAPPAADEKRGQVHTFGELECVMDTDFSTAIDDASPPQAEAAASTGNPLAGLTNVPSPLRFHNRFSRLSGAFYSRVASTPLPDPYLVAISTDAAEALGLDPAFISSSVGRAAFSGNLELSGSEPLAAVYSGHQFGIWAGQLGDGRAISLGEVHGQDARWELQLKGAGMTPYSRMGDGRAVLRSSIREFLCSEAMAALGIPTTRALCIMGSDQAVARETIETAAVLTRVAPSFIRFGSFEHWSSASRVKELRELADFVIHEFFADVQDAREPYAELLRQVTVKTAQLVAQWQSVGFCHGVMNTDNMSILGLTLDYGPFGFLEAFDAAHICNHSDQAGRYAWQRQPQIAHWNLICLAQALLPLIGSVELAQAALAPFKDEFSRSMTQLLHAKLGLVEIRPEDDALTDRMFALLQDNHPDFTLFFRRLCDFRQSDPSADGPLRDLFLDRPAFDAWASDYRARLAHEQSDDLRRAKAMRGVNPKYILRNYLAQAAIEKATQKDFSEIEKLLRILEAPFDEQDEHERYAAPPPDGAAEIEVSCSS